MCFLQYPIQLLAFQPTVSQNQAANQQRHLPLLKHCHHLGSALNQILLQGVKAHFLSTNHLHQRAAGSLELKEAGCDGGPASMGVSAAALFAATVWRL